MVCTSFVHMKKQNPKFWTQHWSEVVFFSPYLDTSCRFFTVYVKNHFELSVIGSKMRHECGLSHLDSKRIKPVSPKGNQLWIFFRRTGAETEAPNFGHLMGRVNSLEKTLMLGKTEGKRRGDDRGWDGWMASLTQWTWVWANSGR